MVEAVLLAFLCLALFIGLACLNLHKEHRSMGKLIVWVMAACLLSGCGAIGAAPSLTIVADRPGCSTIARAFMLEDAPAPTADQVLSGVLACEERDRLGAIQLGQRAPGR